MNSESFYTQRFFYSHYVFKGAKLAKFIRHEAGWKVCLFSFTKFTENWWNDCVFERTEEHWKLWRCEVEIFFFMKRFFTMLRFVQNDTVLFFYSRLGIWIILNAKIFYYSYIFKGAKLAKFIRYEALWKLMWDEVRDAACEVRVFLSQSSRSYGEMMAFLRALRNIGNCEDVKLKYFALWRDSSLCCASFRMTRFCFFTHD